MVVFSVVGDVRDTAVRSTDPPTVQTV
jgi:hypothetical protein